MRANEYFCFSCSEQGKYLASKCEKMGPVCSVRTGLIENEIICLALAWPLVSCCADGRAEHAVKANNAIQQRQKCDCCCGRVVKARLTNAG